MRILFYTNAHRGATDAYNIAAVRGAFPQASFLALVYASDGSGPRKTLLQKLFSKGRNFSFAKLIQKYDRAVFERRVWAALNPAGLDGIEQVLVSELNGAETERRIREFSPDYVIQCGAGILKENIFSLAKKATLNVHHGLAPEVRGMWSTLWCLYYGLEEHIGVTCHIIDETLDTGPIIAQYRHRKLDGQDYAGIQIHLIREGAKLLVDAINRLESADPRQFNQRTVTSFYFSDFPADKYLRLRRKGFAAVAPDEIPSLRSKLKVKTTLVDGEGQGS